MLNLLLRKALAVRMNFNLEIMRLSLLTYSSQGRKFKSIKLSLLLIRVVYNMFVEILKRRNLKLHFEQRERFVLLFIV